MSAGFSSYTYNNLKLIFTFSLLRVLGLVLDEGLISDDFGVPEAAGDPLVDEVAKGAQPDTLGGEEEIVVGAKGKLPSNILIHPPCDVHSVMQRD